MELLELVKQAFRSLLKVFEDKFNLFIFFSKMLPLSPPTDNEVAPRSVENSKGY